MIMQKQTMNDISVFFNNSVIKKYRKRKIKYRKRKITLFFITAAIKITKKKERKRKRKATFHAAPHAATELSL